MLKVLRVVGVYALAWLVSLVLSAILFVQDYVGYAILFTFSIPVIVVWWNERRIRKKKEQKNSAENAKMRELENALTQKEKEVLIQVAADHLVALRRNFRKAMTYNDYGALIRDERQLAAHEFLESTGTYLKHTSLEDATQYLSEFLEMERKAQIGRTSDIASIPTDGFEFENWVSQRLQALGWSARVTQGSGDQGVDVIAEQGKLSIGIQCKLYSSNIGNKAVQEAFSGAKFMDLRLAAVVTNTSYTRSAEDLASSLGVMLLHIDDLPNLKTIAENSLSARR